jgi:hypothetical protein
MVSVDQTQNVTWGILTIFSTSRACIAWMMKQQNRKYIFLFILWMHVSLKFLDYTCASGSESTVARTQKTKLYRPRRFDLASFVKGSVMVISLESTLVKFVLQLF